ncbi:hypothetical protein U1Q18_031789 [Sarracenia purpurea var. burkii]
MFFGVSCAFFALRLSSEPEMNDEKWSEMRNILLRGSAHLLGLLVYGAQRVETLAGNGDNETLLKLENAGREIQELKKRRSEDAKANEKVAGIFSAHEQSWLSERKRLRLQIGALLNELRAFQNKRDETISEFNEKLQEKDRLLEIEERKRKELEEKLKESRNFAEELREAAKREAQERSSELWKHKTAFIELVSNQRQIEAEMGRAVTQFESTKRELDSAMAQKEESVILAQKISVELIKTRKDLEQKDKILSAMLRKSKLDTTEKQMLLKEIKLSKAKKKQAEMETERLRAVYESRRERNSLKSMLSKHSSSQIGRNRSQQTDFVMEDEQQTGHQKEPKEAFSPLYDRCSREESEELTDVKQLEGWVRSEAEKYSTLVEQRHQLEINAFAEQLRLKDEKLEAFRWRLLSTELESKRFQSHIEGLNHELSQLRQENSRLDDLLMAREAEINSLKQKLALNSCSQSPVLGHETDWSKVRIVKGKAGEKEHETKMGSADISHEVEPWKEEETPRTRQPKDIILTVQSPEKEFEEEKVVTMSPDEVDIVEKPTSSGQCLMTSTWKMDIHALGVSYKLKRLKQQLLMLERLIGKREGCEDKKDDDNSRVLIKGLHILMSLLNKQVSRYQSLEEKTDELCKRMHEDDLDVGRGGSSIAKSKEETKALEHFLEETFQLQRYVVATGQKVMEIQSKVASGFVEAAEELLDGSAAGAGGFDMKRFADSVGTLFREVQRGLEVRIARIIGNLEGTLACDGIIHLRKK